MMFGWIIIIPLILIGIWYFNQNKINSSAKQDRQEKQEKPMDILKKRFAAGEITSKEYEERKAELGK